MENNEQQTGGTYCPKCGKQTVQLQREISPADNQYHTVGFCQSCGHTWQTDAAAQSVQPSVVVQQVQPKKKDHTAAKVVFITLGAVLVLGMVGNMGKNNSKTTTGTTEATAATAENGDADSATPNILADLRYDIEDDRIIIKSYKGKNETLEIAASYKIDGVTYKTDLSDAQFRNDRIKTIIFDEGITEFQTSIFISSSKIENIYFPKSVLCVYDYTLGYLNPKDDQQISIHYAGTQEEWEQIFTKYQRTKVSDADADNWGEALADALNEKTGVTTYDSAKFVYYFAESDNPVNDVEPVVTMAVVSTPEAQTEFRVGETWTVEGEWSLTINSIELTADRNQFDHHNPAVVYYIDYTYENLGYDSYWMNDDTLTFNITKKIVDSEGYTGYTYPNDVTYPEPTPVGAKCKVRSCIGVDNAGPIKLVVTHDNSKGKDQTATFIIGE